MTRLKGWTNTVWQFFLPVYAVFFVLYAFFLSFGENGFLITSAVYSSDLVQPYLIAQDALSNPALLFSWNYSPALYVFPDLLFAGLFSALPLPNLLLPVCYGAGLLTAYTCAISYCFNRCVQDRGVYTGWFVAASLALLAAAAVFCGGSLSKAVFFWLTSAFIHTGALLIGLITMGLYINAVQHKSRRVLVLLVILVLATSFSDFIYIGWFVVPSFVVGLVIYWSEKRLAAIRLSEYLLTAAICGLILEVLLRHGVYLKAYMATCDVNIGLLADLTTRIRAGDLGLAVVVVLNLLLWGRAIAIVYAVVITRGNTQRDAWVLFLALSSLASFSFVVLLGLQGCYIDSIVLRYMLPFFMNPVIWLIMLVGGYLLRVRARLVAQFSTALLVASAFVIVISPNLTSRFVKNNQSPVVQCLLDHQLNQGYTGWLSAKRYMFLSNDKLHLMPLDQSANPVFMNYNMRWFKVGRQRMLPLHPNFVVMDRLDRDEVVRKFGSPSNMLDCDGHLVYVYRQGLPLPNETTGQFASD